MQENVPWKLFVCLYVCVCVLSRSGSAAHKHILKWYHNNINTKSQKLLLIKKKQKQIYISILRLKPFIFFFLGCGSTLFFVLHENKFKFFSQTKKNNFPLRSIIFRMVKINLSAAWFIYGWEHIHIHQQYFCYRIKLRFLFFFSFKNANFVLNITKKGIIKPQLKFVIQLRWGRRQVKVIGRRSFWKLRNIKMFF